MASLVLFVAVTSFFVQPAQAQSMTEPDYACLQATNQDKEAVKPPRLYFLPFCDQTPRYFVNTSNGQLVSKCDKGSNCSKYDEYCMPVRNCQPDDFAQTFANLARVGIIALPVIALVFLIWAGFNLITSGGNAEKVQQGKKMMVSVLLGTLIIIVLAWFWTTFIVFIITGSTTLWKGTDNERLWWGGGTSTTEETFSPNAGCCVTPQGCLEGTSQSQCDEYETTGKYCVRIPITGAQLCSTSWAQAISCSSYSQCITLQSGCCLPIDGSNDCITPEPGRGCSDWADTHELIDSVACGDIDQCQP